jgi:hypothetical protein
MRGAELDHHAPTPRAMMGAQRSGRIVHAAVDHFAVARGHAVANAGRRLGDNYIMAGKRRRARNRKPDNTGADDKDLHGGQRPEANDASPNDTDTSPVNWPVNAARTSAMKLGLYAAACGAKRLQGSVPDAGNPGGKFDHVVILRRRPGTRFHRVDETVSSARKRRERMRQLPRTCAAFMSNETCATEPILAATISNPVL